MNSSHYDTIESVSLKITSGLTPLRTKPEYWENGSIPWLKTEQLGEYQINETSEKISQIAIDETSIKINPVNTVSIAMYGEGQTRGNVSILKKQMTTNQACCNIIVNEEIADYRYVYYWLKNNYYQIRNLSSGIRNNLNSDDIKNFPFNYKELSEQRKIADMLTSLDDKISLNNRINAELEQMAKTMYDYWFVQFDFPISAAEAATMGDARLEGKPYKTSGGEMVLNEELKREVPVGWEVKSLYDIAKYTNGLAMQNYRPKDENALPVIKIREMNEGYSSGTEFARGDMDSEYVIKAGDVLFSWSASLNIMLWVDKPGALNQHIFKVSSKEYPRFYFYYQIANYLNHFKQMAENRKTTMGHITKDHLFESRIVVPKNIRIIEKCKDQIECILDLMVKNSLQNHELTRLRDFILPMLMNGQVSISEK